MATPQHTGDSHLTYRDYAAWDDGQRWELTRGTATSMGPAPSPTHQGFLMELCRQVGNYLEGKPCRAFPAPFDVRLPEAGQSADDARTVLQPDLSVVCNEDKIDRRGCCGSPDVVFEILSPSTAPHDFLLKRELYEEHGVREYWLIDPLKPVVTLFCRAPAGGFGPAAIHRYKRRIASEVLEGLVLDFTGLYDEEDLNIVLAEPPAPYGATTPAQG